VGLNTKTSKAAALRERCQQSLGRMFPEVYAYLRKMRMEGSLGGLAGLRKERRKSIYVGSEALPTSIKERKTTRAAGFN